MKIVTVGFSPYLLTSRARLNKEILEYLYVNKYQVMSFVRGHDRNYFIPEGEEGKKKFFYTFEINEVKHKIPIIPLDINKDEKIVLMELINLTNPDVVITIGAYPDFLTMQAIKQVCKKDFKWLFVLTHFNSPINENIRPIIQYADGVFCTSEFGRKDIHEIFPKETLDCQWVGCSSSLDIPRKTKSSFKVMACSKKSPSDNLPMLMEVAKNLLSDIPNLELYLNTNLHDKQDHDIELLKERFDPEDNFLRLPSKFVSIVEGLPDKELADEYCQSDVFVSIPVNAATSMTVFEALSYGCYPILTDCGSNTEIVKELAIFLDNKQYENDFLVRTIPVLVPGETYIGIPDPEDLKRKIVTAHETLKKNEGIREGFVEFSKKYKRRLFLEKMTVLLERVVNSSPVVCLETI